MSDEENNINKEEILKIENLGHLSDFDGLNYFGGLVDFASDKNDRELKDHLLKLSETFNLNEMNNFNRALYYYILSEIYNDKYGIDKALNNYDESRLNKYIINLRLALNEINKTDLNEVYKIDLYCRINTNLGNQFLDLGRITEAIEFWENAINIDNKFKMSIGNLGNGLFLYQNLFYEESHRYIFINKAYKLMTKSLEDTGNSLTNLIPEARKGFQEKLKFIEQNYPEIIEDNIDLESKMGKSKKEIEYRNWCLNNRLFLNPINDLGSYSIAASDILYLPTMTFNIEQKQYHFGLYNVIKQEYVSSRYLLYDSIKSFEKFRIHFSDKKNYLEDTLDYSYHSLSVEKMKASFRVSYSILDKIAYFINEYFGIGKNRNRINFGNIWKIDGELINEVRNNDNYILEGLYWLSRDVYTKGNDYELCLLPDAEEINNIRNHIEHKYLKITMMEKENDLDLLNDDLAFIITRDRFFNKTIRLLKIVRAAIMYLSFAIHFEERKKRDNIPDEKIGTIENIPLGKGLRF